LAADVARDADVEAQIEGLLLEGLDRYFDHQYDDAIHVWTRVLFLDRSHARARAYIDRARTALAERQRRADELLQAAQDLIDRGETDSARDLLRKVVAHGGDDERAAALRLKLERRARARATAFVDTPLVSPHETAVPGWTWRSHSRWGAAVLVIGVVGVAGILADIVGRDALAPSSTAEVATARPERSTPMVLSTCDVALIRARALYSRGRLAEALQALDRVPDSSASRGEAETFRREIQRLLLATAQQPRSSSSPRGPNPS
jgi:tetratricopeptide (TPR) repeat protein